MKKRFNWRNRHSAVVALWGGVAGFYAAWPAFQETVNPYYFAVVSVTLGAAIAVHALSSGAE